MSDQAKKVRKSATQRQQDYIKRQKEKGYVLLSSIWVPASQKEIIRQKVQSWVDEFEKEASSF